MKRLFAILFTAGIFSLTAVAIATSNQVPQKVNAASGQPGFTYAASYRRPMHFSDPLTSDGNGTYGDKYLNCYLSVDRTDSGLDFDLAWTGTINEHSWFTIVLGDTDANLYSNVTMDTNYDKFMIKPIGGIWAFGAPGVLKSPTNKTFYDWPVSSGWPVISSYNYDADNKNVTFHVDYSDLNTMSSKTDNPHIFAVQFYHHPDASPSVDNTLMGASPWWKATDINGSCSGDIALMRGNPYLAQCDPDLAVSEFAPTHTWSVGAKYGARGSKSYTAHAAQNEYYCELTRDDANKELILDVQSAGTMEIANSGVLYKNIEFVFTTLSSNLGGWNINSTDLVTRVYRKSNNEMFADVVTGDLASSLTTINNSELFPDFAGNTHSYDYAAHTVATPKSTLVEDNQFGTHFRIAYDLNDADLALLLGDFKVQGIPYVGTDGVWDINDTWNLSGNQYFGRTISDTGDMASQTSYIPINSTYFEIQNALHYFFNNVNRDSEHSMCSIFSDSTRLSEVVAWYLALGSDVVDKLALTPDFKVTVKDTMDYILYKANVGNPHGAALFSSINNRNTIIIIAIVVMISVSAVSCFLIIRKKKRA